MIKAVIFDMDGVIIDSEPLQLMSFNHILNAYDVKVSMEEFKEHYMGLKDVQICYEMIKDYKLSISKEDFVKKKRFYYIECIRTQSIQPIKGANKAIKYVVAKGLRLAIASSSSMDEINAVITKFGIKKYFHIMVSAHDVLNGKPAPDVYLKASEKLGVLPELCIAVEDTPTGIKSAKAAGMKCVAITTTHQAKELYEADRTMGSFDEMPKILEGLQ